MRLRECEYVHCSGCGAVRAQSSLPVSSVHGFGVWGAARSHDQKVKRLPTLRGGPAQRPHQIHLPTSWARAERVPDCSSHLSRIPGGATDSGSSIHPRDSRGSPSDETILSHRTGRHHALLNASAASESTAAGGLEAFSQSSAGTERNLSPSR